MEDISSPGATDSDNSSEVVLSQRTSCSPTFVQPNPKRSSLPSHPNVAARHFKRLTLNFPISPPINLRSEQSSPSSTLVTPATESSLNLSPIRSASTVPSSGDGLDGGYDFLTAIASQERRVLELREELQRAEMELANLKKQWALTGRVRKRPGICHHAESMKPLKSPVQDPGVDSTKISERNDGGVDTSSTTQRGISGDQGRRNSLRAPTTAAANRDISVSVNGRRIFPGSKHTRALSLLSPDMSGAFHPPLSQLRSTEDKKPVSEQTSRYPRAATLPSMERSDPTKAISSVNEMMPASELLTSEWRRSMPPASREALMRTGKQMASDFRDGLWTFFEDIRQATVGEEGINATQSRSIQATPTISRSKSKSDHRNTPSKSRERSAVGDVPSNSPSSFAKAVATTKSGKDTIQADIEVSFWSEFGVDTPGQKSKTTKAAQNTPKRRKESENSNLLGVDDNWDMWETPQSSKIHTPSSRRSTIESKDRSPSTQRSTPRTSTRYVS
jgi:hypothetical protein